MRNRLLFSLALAVSAALIVPTFPSASMAQDAPAKGKGAKGKAKASGPPRPTPHFADGTVNFGPLPGEKGVWGIGSALVRRNNNANANPLAPPLPTPDEVPFLPWARALFDHRGQTLTADDPHVRCKSESVARLFQTPYGFEIVQAPDMQRVFIMGVGGPHSYHEIYMDGRPHPVDLAPSYQGHAAGHWEGETLVIDTVGYSVRSWITREGEPTTEQLHTIERISRPNYETLVYEITVDDPGAYSAPWKAGWAIPWNAGNEMYEFICQENNRDSRHMVGGDQK